MSTSFFRLLKKKFLSFGKSDKKNYLPVIENNNNNKIDKSYSMHP